MSCQKYVRTEIKESQRSQRLGFFVRVDHTAKFGIHLLSTPATVALLAKFALLKKLTPDSVVSFSSADRN